MTKATLKVLKALPFVKEGGKGEPRNFWSVAPTGNYCDDWRTGEIYALEALKYMARRDTDMPAGNFLLGHIATHLQALGSEYSGVELGFFNCIGAFAAFHRQRRGDQFYRDYMMVADQHWEEGKAEQAKIRSERARKAAKARWAKTKQPRRAGPRRREKRRDPTSPPTGPARKAGPPTQESAPSEIGLPLGNRPILPSARCSQPNPYLRKNIKAARRKLGYR